MWNRTKTRQEKDLHGRREGGCSGRKVGCGFTRIVKDRAKSITAIAEARTAKASVMIRGKEATKSQGTPAVLQKCSASRHIQHHIYQSSSSSSSSSLSPSFLFRCISAAASAAVRSLPAPPPPLLLLSVLVASAAGEGAGGGPSVLRRE
jgi:hypothetical protein